MVPLDAGHIVYLQTTPNMQYFMSRLPCYPSLQSYSLWIGVSLTGLFLSESSWPQLQDSQEPTSPPRLQEDTWRTGGVILVRIE